MIWTTGPSLGGNQGSRASSYPVYQDFQQRAVAFSHVFCRYYTPLSISLGNQTERVTGELVSGNYFQALGKIGLRMALGARQGALLWMVMQKALGLLGLGLALGIPCTYLLSRYVSSQLFGVVAADLGTAALASIALLAVAAGAALMPSRRASRIDPIQALHQE
jgi:hypothetical protein